MAHVLLMPGFAWGGGKAPKAALEAQLGSPLAPTLLAGMMGLSLPSPNNLLFGLPSSSGLFTSRGGLNLDLPMPDSAGLAQALDWPTTSR